MNDEQQIQKLVKALLGSGERNFDYVMNTHNETPELFEEWEVKQAMVTALKTGDSVLGCRLMEWLRRFGEEIIPLLLEDFDPQGKKDMQRRVQLISAIGGAKYNNFYLRNLPDSLRNIKMELIYALRHTPANVEVLLQLAKKEKNTAQEVAYYALAEIEDERAEAFFRKLYEANSIEAMLHLSMSTTKWASDLVAESLLERLKICSEPDYGNDDKVFIPMETEVLRITIGSLYGKTGEKICAAYRCAFEVSEIYYKTLKDKNRKVWGMSIPVRRPGGSEIVDLAGAIAYMLESSIRINPTKELALLATELYEREDFGNKNLLFFSAVLTSKILEEDCSRWLEDQLKGNGKEQCIKSLEKALEGIVYDEAREGYFLQTTLKDAASKLIEKEIFNVSMQLYEKPIEWKIQGDFLDIILKYQYPQKEKQLVSWINQGDEATCKKLEKFFHWRALNSGREEMLQCWNGLDKCGCESCEGLLVAYLQKERDTRGLRCSQLIIDLGRLPGSLDSFEKETQKVFEMICADPTAYDWNEERYWSFVESGMKKR